MKQVAIALSGMVLVYRDIYDCSDVEGLHKVCESGESSTCCTNLLWRQSDHAERVLRQAF